MVITALQNSLQNETHKADLNRDACTLVMWWIFSSRVRVLNVWLLGAFVGCL